MGASKKIKMVLVDRELTQVDLAKITGKHIQTLRNLLHRDSMSYETVESIADALGCDIVFKDRVTGKIYE